MNQINHQHQNSEHLDVEPDAGLKALWATYQSLRSEQRASDRRATSDERTARRQTMREDINAAIQSRVGADFKGVKVVAYESGKYRVVRSAGCQHSYLVDLGRENTEHYRKCAECARQERIEAKRKQREEPL